MSTKIDGTLGVIFPDNSSQNTSAFAGGLAFRNRIINGAMMIDQRNAGAAGSAINTYTVDRWQYIASQSGKLSWQQNLNAITPPAGFTNYLGVVSASAYSVAASDYFILWQPIEGYNVADLGFGAAGASTVTFSFWVRSSLTGTFGGTFRNSANDRNYVFSYTINAANTWEQKTITIAGDTTGTWLKTNGTGLTVAFSLGMGSSLTGTAGSWGANSNAAPTGSVNLVGTNGATFYITGVQLEKGSTATSFDYRPYGTELALCQRYYYRIYAAGSQFGPAFSPLGNYVGCIIPFPVPMRIAPSALEQSGVAGDYMAFWNNGGIACNAVQSFYKASISSGWTVSSVASGITQNTAGVLYAANSNAYLGWSAEL